MKSKLAYTTIHVNLGLIVYKTNVLINDSGEASLADFGTSRILRTSGYTTKNVSGTRRWSAVELLKEELDGDVEILSTRISKETDIWALGMVVYVSPIAFNVLVDRTASVKRC